MLKGGKWCRFWAISRSGCSNYKKLVNHKIFSVRTI